MFTRITKRSVLLILLIVLGLWGCGQAVGPDDVEDVIAAGPNPSIPSMTVVGHVAVPLGNANPIFGEHFFIADPVTAGRLLLGECWIQSGDTYLSLDWGADAFNGNFSLTGYFPPAINDVYGRTEFAKFDLHCPENVSRIFDYEINYGETPIHVFANLTQGRGSDLGLNYLHLRFIERDFLDTGIIDVPIEIEALIYHQAGEENRVAFVNNEDEIILGPFFPQDLNLESMARYLENDLKFYGPGGFEEESLEDLNTIFVIYLATL